jgi:hypothetical protein
MERALVLLALVGTAGTPADPTVVGSGGEVWRQQGETLQRVDRGGVATTLVGARDLGGVVWAIGGTPPPYRWDGTWHAAPVKGTGVAALGAGPALSFASGRRARVLDATNKKKPRWVELPFLGKKGAPRIAAMWASAPRDVVAATEDGALWRYAGGWKPITVPEAIVAVFGGATPYAASATTLYAIGPKAARAVPLAKPLEAFAPRLAAAGKKKLWLVGDATVAGKTEASLAVLVDKSKLAVVETLPQLPDAPVALLAADDGAAVLITSTTVWRRAAAGGWTQLALGPAQDGAHASNPPARTP